MLQIYIWTVNLAGVLSLSWALIRLMGSWTTFPQALALLLLILLSEALITRVFEHTKVWISVDSAAILASLLLGGPQIAVIIAFIAGVLAYLQLLRIHRKARTWRGIFRKALFNGGMYALSALMAGAVFTQLKAFWIPLSSLRMLLDVLISAVVYDLTNMALLLAGVSLESGQPVGRVWEEILGWAQPIHVGVTAVGGWALALGMQKAGYTGLFIFFLPVALSSYAFRLYVRRTETQMARLEEIVQERTQELRNFFSIVNHEMRAPITSIIGYADLLLAMPRDELVEQAPPFLRTIRTNGEQLLRLVNDILDLARIEAGGIEIRPVETSFTGVVEGAWAVVRPLAEQKGLGFELNLEPDLPPVWVDPERMKQVMVNLLSNAVKYTDRGKVGVRVRKVIQEGVPWLEVQVWDTGPGIPPEEIPQLFRRFHRVPGDHTRRVLGTGLGLVIARHLVEGHGGRIWVESQVGRGTSFFFRIPAQPLEGRQSPSTVSPR